MDTVANSAPPALVLIEHDGRQVCRASLQAVTFACRLGLPYRLVVLGHGLEAIAACLSRLGPVWLADDPRLAEPLADRYAAVIVELAQRCGASHLLAVASTFSKDILPRVAALLDAGMVSDVLAVHLKGGQTVYERPMSAGSLRAHVTLEGPVRVLTVRAGAFATPAEEPSAGTVERHELGGVPWPDGTEFVWREERPSQRPELGEARVVVSGGRPLKDKATFDRLIGGLADALGGAVGATRAAVDASMAPNDCQIGQTGKVISPELYVAVGVSGAIQHLAGIQDARVIVAINSDADAPIFQVANYGLVGDLHQLTPRLIEAVSRS
jgi:electron transfer flavoprotein alpha subunit